ncbi:hypothetical protein O0L34_g1531 [Tuta absoluta]|nr:hypothetical protein O0L34_g1531 [Tuta absoluta]
MWRLLLIGLVVSIQGRYENTNVQLDWWETAVFYQVYVRSFMDSDGDGVGDINGVNSRLEYFKELNVDAVILTPIYKSPMYDYGYDVSDYYNVQPEYGSMEDFEQLLRKANLYNIKIVLEFVPNHTSNESDWFIRSCSRDEYYTDWYIWENGHIDRNGQRNPPNNWISVFRKSAWTYSPTRDQYYLHQFGTSQPDLNLRNPVVAEEIKNIIKFWLEKGVAGMKMSSVNHLFEVDRDNFGGHFPDEPRTGKPGLGPDDYGYLNHFYTKDLEESYELISQFREVFDSISVRDNLTRVFITEASTGVKNAVRYYGDNVHSGSHVPINFALMDLNKDADARELKYALDRWLTFKPLHKRANWMTGNQDKSRVASRFRGELVDAFNMLVLLMPGIALTYMGEEIGMQDGYVPWTATRDPIACKTDDPINFVLVTRDPARTPFQWSSNKHAGFTTNDNTWLPVADGYDRLNVANQRSAVRSHYQVYRTLTSLRMRPAFRLGHYESLAINNDVFAFKRWFNDDTYVVVMNVGRSYHVVNLTAFDLVFGSMEVEASSVLSSRTFSENVQAGYLDLTADEALVLRMQV